MFDDFEERIANKGLFKYLDLKFDAENHIEY